MKRVLQFSLLLLLVSCYYPPRWIMTEELEPALDPNILELQLHNGSYVVFDSKTLGWYDAKKGYIEGLTPIGHDTILLTRIERIEVTSSPNQSGTILLILGIFLIVGVIGGVYWFGTIFS